MVKIITNYQLPITNYPFGVRGCASSRHPRRQMLHLGKPRQVLQVGGAAQRTASPWR
ncbi:hypothetical protein [Tolypothrix sp. VBCCA 56010]|uniref:hypothetical protein n=1 Tax=Tolypothrix sp. VBCCA 56010 TaxID=3137731 RepID=UPI003D7CB2FE